MYKWAVESKQNNVDFITEAILVLHNFIKKYVYAENTFEYLESLTMDTEG